LRIPPRASATRSSEKPLGSAVSAAGLGEYPSRDAEDRDRNFDAGVPRKKGAVGRPTGDDQPRTSAPEEPVTAFEGTHGELNIALRKESDNGAGGSKPLVPPSPLVGGGAATSKPFINLQRQRRLRRSSLKRC
jgi:hypothetical protein